MLVRSLRARVALVALGLLALNACGSSGKGRAPSAIAAPAAQERAGITPGDPAPASTVATGEGSRELADSWREGVVLLVFYRGHWCPTCRTQLLRLQERLEDLEQAGVRVIGLSADKAADAASLRQKLALGYDVYGDPELGVIRAWQVEDETGKIARPAAFIVARGEVVYRYVGKNPADHPTVDELLGALAEHNRAR